MNEQELLNILAQRIYDKKGFNIFAMDVRDVTSFTDFFLIAEGNVERHVQALGREVLETLNEYNLPVFHVDGDRTGDWMVIDSGRVLIHLFIPELRERYALEELWREGKIVDLAIQLDKDKNH
jgi:ribosome-associated protein